MPVGRGVGLRCSLIDETQAGLGPAAETEIVPPATVAAAELAWSDDQTEEIRRRSWGWAWGVAAAIAVSLGVVAAVIVVPHWMRPAPTPSVFIGGPSWTKPAAVPPPPPPVSLSAVPPSARAPLQYDARGLPLLPTDPTAEERQQVLLASLDHAGVPYSSPRAAVIDADSLCEYLKTGHHTFADLVAWAQKTHPLLSGDQPASFTGAAVGTYCRQYGFLIDPANDGATS